MDKKLFLITNLMNRKFNEVLTKLESGKKSKEESFVVRQIDPRVVEVRIDHLERVIHLCPRQQLSWFYERMTHLCPRRQREMLQKMPQKSPPKQGEHEQNWSICSHYVSWLSIVHVKAFEGVIEWMWGVLKDTYNKSGGSLGMSKICPCIIRNSLNCSEQWKLISFSI